MKIREDSILLFDMDGTLIETDYANFLAYQKALMESNVKYKIDFDSNIRFNRETLVQLFPNLTSAELRNIAQLKNKYYYEYLTETSIIPYTHDILKKHAKTHRIILVTASRNARALATLDYHNIIHLFDDYCFKQESSKNKFELFSKQFTINLDQAILFENEEREVQNAINIGIKTQNIFNPN